MVKARSAGSFLGGIFNNPGVVILGGLAIALLFFQGDIRKAFGDLGKGFGQITLPDIKLPDITLPEINFPEFPALPDFSGFFTGLQDQQTNFFKQFTDFFTGGGAIPQPQKMVEDTGLIDFSKCKCGATIIQDAFGNVFSECKKCADEQLPSLDPGSNVPSGDLGGVFGTGLLDFLGLTPAQQFALDKGLSPQQEQQIIVPAVNQFGIGGGTSFIGGTTTFGNTIVDTLSEVLNLFPGLTASQARDALEEFPGLTQTEFRLIDPDVRNISSAGIDPNQILLNASGGFSGLTPSQIAFILTGGNIQNF